MDDSMDCTPIFHSVNVRKGCWGRAWLNGLPLYKGMYIGPQTRSAAINHLLIPGQNEVTAEVLKVRAPDNPHMDVSRVEEDQFELLFYEVLNPNAPADEGIERKDVYHVRYPQMMEAAPPRHQRIPFYFKGAFTPSISVAPPLFASAPQEQFGCDGTPELHDAVRRIHQALATQQWDSFLDELELKFTHAESVYRGIDQHKYASKRALFHAELFPRIPVPESLDMAALHFEPLRGGSVAHVTRKDGGFAINAPCEKDPRSRIQADFLMLRHAGRWRVFA